MGAKTPAFAAELPALSYGELAGWGQGGDITRQAMTLVLLRHGGSDPGVAALYAATGAPCLPVALNTGLFWGRRGFTRRPEPIQQEILDGLGAAVDAAGGTFIMSYTTIAGTAARLAS